MIAAIDVQYWEPDASVGCVVFQDWQDPSPGHEYCLRVPEIEPYTPGQFYKRELPCIQAALRTLSELPGVIIVDGYVWLDDAGRKGLGAHLYDALDGQAAVVGVAKTPFLGSAHAAPVYRGNSRQPLYVTAEGIAQQEAADAVASMHGAYRIPTLLKRVDMLCRGG